MSWLLSVLHVCNIGLFRFSKNHCIGIPTTIFEYIQEINVLVLYAFITWFRNSNHFLFCCCFPGGYVVHVCNLAEVASNTATLRAKCCCRFLGDSRDFCREIHICSKLKTVAHVMLGIEIVISENATYRIEKMSKTYNGQ